ncbi:tetratricopeptide repeat protein [Rhodoflexus sp.]
MNPLRLSLSAFFGFLLSFLLHGQNIELNTQPAYQNFVTGKNILHQKALLVPNSPFALVLVAIRRTEDVANWSQDPADGIHARLFAYDLTNKRIDEAQSEMLNRQMGSDKFYEPDYCGGLGSLAPDDFKADGQRIVITRFYAAGTARSNCTDEIIYSNGQLFLQKERAIDTGLGAEVAKERIAMNQQALQRYQQGDIQGAISIWEQLFSYWQNGPFATAGPMDEVMNNLGFAYYKIKDFRKAEQLLLECKKNFPNRSIINLNLADLYRDDGQISEAIKYYEVFLQASNLSANQIAYAKRQLEMLKR